MCRAAAKRLWRRVRSRRGTHDLRKPGLHFFQWIRVAAAGEQMRRGRLRVDFDRRHHVGDRGGTGFRAGIPQPRRRRSGRALLFSPRHLGQHLLFVDENLPVGPEEELSLEGRATFERRVDGGEHDVGKFHAAFRRWHERGPPFRFDAARLAAQFGRIATTVFKSR